MYLDRHCNAQVLAALRRPHPPACGTRCHQGSGASGSWAPGAARAAPETLRAAGAGAELAPLPGTRHWPGLGLLSKAAGLWQGLTAEPPWSWGCCPVGSPFPPSSPPVSCPAARLRSLVPTVSALQGEQEISGLEGGFAAGEKGGPEHSWRGRGTPGAQLPAQVGLQRWGRPRACGPAPGSGGCPVLTRCPQPTLRPHSPRGAQLMRTVPAAAVGTVPQTEARELAALRAQG